jgi:prfA: peptide chain release factor 1
MNIYDQLQAVEDRYEELGELLSDPDVVSDTTRFMDLSKEEASTRETVAVYREYKKVLQNIEDAEEMIKDAGGDPELEEMAKEELKESKAVKEDYEENLKSFFYQKTLTMIKTSSWKSAVPLEVMKQPSLQATFFKCTKNTLKAKVGSLRLWKLLTTVLVVSKKLLSWSQVNQFILN